MLLNQSASLSSSQKWLSRIIAVFGASILIAACANVTVPMVPVPMTLQTAAVIFTGLALGSRLGAVALLVYLGEGLSGLPVFAGGKFGLIHLFGPTGGFLIGFILSAFLAGLLAEGWIKQNWLRAVFAAVLAGAILYVPGLLWLGASIGFDKPIMQLGLYPFIIGDLAKACLAASIYIGGYALLSKRII